jgi:putative transposase
LCGLFRFWCYTGAIFGESRYRTHHDAIADVREYVAVYYNAKRLHLTPGYTTPNDYEKRLSKVFGPC